MEQGKYKDVVVGLKNVYGQKHDFKYEIITTDIPPTTTETQVLSWVRYDKSVLSLSSGQLYTDTISIDPKNAPLGVYKLKLILTCLTCPDETQEFAPLTMRIVSK